MVRPGSGGTADFTLEDCDRLGVEWDDIRREPLRSTVVGETVVAILSPSLVNMGSLEVPPTAVRQGVLFAAVTPEVPSATSLLKPGGRSIASSCLGRV